MATAPKTFVGFGFGAIQAGLMLYEADASRNFERLVVAEVVPGLVKAVRDAGGRYRVNVARPGGVDVREIGPIEILNPGVAEDGAKLAERLAEASEIATALPSVDSFQKGTNTVAGFIGEAWRRKLQDQSLPRAVVYTCENHNRAAEILEAACEARLDLGERAGAGSVLQFLNTVIGKMSGVVQGVEEVRSEGLVALTDGVAHAFLVEEFNRILITRVRLPGFHRGIAAFVEKDDLLPFEEAKLYGHNAVHALLGYLAMRKGIPWMSLVKDDDALINLAREAFLVESGPALIARHRGEDPLFTVEGYRAYAEDLLERMTNPYLRDRTARVTRDSARKLGWDDRLIGTMRLALDAGIRPWRFALGAAAALEILPDSGAKAEVLTRLWTVADTPPGRKAELVRLIDEAKARVTDY